ncbi:hypothetical protein [Prauserella muralis]|uniref:hypothetical protein n=1 Tax=Prauserella muralis TaxID=588067 RepID=UPI0011BF16B7|nr:hypothetical protein [Prauserella muralis]
MAGTEAVKVAVELLGREDEPMAVIMPKAFLSSRISTQSPRRATITQSFCGSLRVAFRTRARRTRADRRSYALLQGCLLLRPREVVGDLLQDCRVSANVSAAFDSRAHAASYPDQEKRWPIGERRPDWVSNGTYDELETQKKAALASIAQLDADDEVGPGAPHTDDIALLDVLPYLTLNLAEAPRAHLRRLLAPGTSRCN